MTPKEDAIARSRRVLEAVDRYCELPTSGTRHALRSLLLDEFNAAHGVKGRELTTRQEIHDEIVRQTGQEYYSPPLHGKPDAGVKAWPPADSWEHYCPKSTGKVLLPKGAICMNCSAKQPHPVGVKVEGKTE